ncbi:MAG: hypothetical protein Q9191_004521, partial [Dirinaria sp. TL-2023a]
MPNYAILGATGATGQALLKHLTSSSSSSDTRINAYARSRARLEKMSPKLVSDPNIQIFEGSLDNISLLASCLSGVSTAFVVIGANVSYPGTRIVQEAVHSVVAALCHLRSQDPFTSLPRILLLSSIGINPRAHENGPAFFNWLLHSALSYSYEDLELAQSYLQLHKSWLKAVFIQPGALSNDVAKGHRLCSDGNTQGFISYADVAAGMVEIAERSEATKGVEGGEFDWEPVVIAPTSDKVDFNWDAPRNL